MSTEPSEPTSEAAFFTTIRSWRIVRGDERIFGGVLSGIGARIGMAPVPARLLFVLVAIFTGGIALLAYAAAWASLPDSEGRIIIQDFGRGTPNVGVLVAIGVMAFFGFLSLNWGAGRWGGWWNIEVPGGADFGNMLPRWIPFFAILIPLAIVGGVVWLIVWAVRQGKDQPSNPAQGYARLPDGTVPTASQATEAVAVDAMPVDGSTDTPPGEATEPAPVFAAAVPIGAAAAAPAAAQPYTAVPAPPVYTGPKVDYTRRPRVPGPGKFGYLAALAMIPISAAITLYLDSTDQLGVFPWVAGGVIWVAGLGLILIINALRGRKAGFLGFMSVVALIPIGLSIASAPEMREYYEEGGWWGWTWVDDGASNCWSWGDGCTEVSAGPVETIAPEPAFDPSVGFTDYESVTINGTCYKAPGATTPNVTGTVRLSDVPADQTITVTSTETLLSIPDGTNLKIVNMGGTDGIASASVFWDDRDLGCDLMSVGSPALELTNADAPVLTVRLDDTLTAGYMTLWIEEN